MESITSLRSKLALLQLSTSGGVEELKERLRANLKSRTVPFLKDISPEDVKRHGVKKEDLVEAIINSNKPFVWSDDSEDEKKPEPEIVKKPKTKTDRKADTSDTASVLSSASDVQSTTSSRKGRKAKEETPDVSPSMRWEAAKRVEEIQHELIAIHKKFSDDPVVAVSIMTAWTVLGESLGEKRK